MWRETARAPRLFGIDARALFPLALFLLHVALWTFVIAAVGVAAFALIERLGYTPVAAARLARTRLMGRQRVIADRGLPVTGALLRRRVRF